MPRHQISVICSQCLTERTVWTRRGQIDLCASCSGKTVLPVAKAASIAAAEQRRKVRDAQPFKICSTCNKSLPNTEAHFYSRKGRDGVIRKNLECKSCTIARAAEWRKKNPEKATALNRAGINRGNAWKKANPEKAKIYRQKMRADIENEFFRAYGNRCTCCGETNPLFLTLEHLNGDGAAHRRQFGKAKGSTDRVTILHDVKRQGWPKDKYTILCFNCNCGKARNGGVCPHATQRPVSRVSHG